MLLRDAKRVALGSRPATAVYLGREKLWPATTAGVTITTTSSETFGVDGLYITGADAKTLVGMQFTYKGTVYTVRSAPSSGFIYITPALQDSMPMGVSLTLTGAGIPTPPPEPPPEPEPEPGGDITFAEYAQEGATTAKINGADARTLVYSYFDYNGRTYFITEAPDSRTIVFRPGLAWGAMYGGRLIVD